MFRRFICAETESGFLNCQARCDQRSHHKEKKSNVRLILGSICVIKSLKNKREISFESIVLLFNQ